MGGQNSVKIALPKSLSGVGGGGIMVLVVLNDPTFNHIQLNSDVNSNAQGFDAIYFISKAKGALKRKGTT